MLIEQINVIHPGVDKEGNSLDVSFGLEEESEGTRKFFGLIGPWLDVLDNGYTLVIDELDTSLHTKLTSSLIKIFNDLDSNKSGAQLIFTTHDTNLLDQEMFRRDQIWFVEKDYKTGSTDIYSLHDFGVRKDEKIEKGYLQGKYGAIPFIKGEALWY